MDPKLAVYLAYAAVTLGLTLWVGHTLHRHGQAFLRDVLPTGELAAAVTRFLVVGFYLLNLGYMAIAMKTYGEVTGPVDAVETLATKIGIIMLALVVVHLCTVLLLGRLRRQMQGAATGPARAYPVAALPQQPVTQQAEATPRRLTPAA
ncbi:hypothetical protein [Catellatospora sp. NPDC049609]|uniref:hypothetical protein n=1 Tax=Catellatospora sp. NPDC049609 TaxID=3155505 RepID=UPI0034381017